MSREHVELALQAFDAINRRHLDALLALIDDDVEIVTRIAAMEGGLHGHDGMGRWWENTFTLFPDYYFEVVDVRDLGRDVGVPACSRSRGGERRAAPSKLGPKPSKPAGLRG